MNSGILMLITLGFGASVLAVSDDNAPKQSFTNSIGMRMVSIAPGKFTMGSEAGEFDERPVRQVEVGRYFSISATEVTNSQFEQFDPSHKSLRGKHGFS
ncbi:MAG: SUMF1/EgtB/PvdO family nonheme iron enzyme, partial [Phycisphaerae bacterium]|nr:SUMF1/EgtB/PvdO family nonheme iron enzyme [Phycisphaerae bacterium]